MNMKNIKVVNYGDILQGVEEWSEKPHIPMRARVSPLVCERCGKEHDGSFGSSRFCSERCKRKLTDEHIQKLKESHNKSAYGNWKCDFCNEVFRTRQLLFAHKKQFKHRSSGKTPWLEFKCQFCGKISHKKSGNTLHEKSCLKNPNRAPGCHFGSHYSEEILNRSFRNNPKQGGVREGSGRGKKGWYKGFYCRSTWELAWLIYELENGSQVEACKESFEYELNGKKHKYYPDFKIGDIFYEIKGWHRPDVDAKVQQFPSDKTLILIEGKKQIAKYLEYTTGKYGSDLTLLYEKRDLRGADEMKFHQ